MQRGKERSNTPSLAEVIDAVAKSFVEDASHCAWGECSASFAGNNPPLAWVRVDLSGAATPALSRRSLHLCPEHARILEDFLKSMPRRSTARITPRRDA
jgi:hypothetical protein